MSAASIARAVRIEDELARRGSDFWTKPRHNNLGQPCPPDVRRPGSLFGQHQKASLELPSGVREAGRRRHRSCASARRRELHWRGKLAGPVPPQALGLGGRGGTGRTTDSAAPQKGVPDRGSLAMAIWCESGDPHGTPVETYLRSRRLELPDEPANEVIRFHADCLFGSERFPAMVCLVRNVITNEPQAIHRTALAPDGTAIKRDGKTHRMSLGPITGGAIKITPDAHVTTSAKASKPH